jgi:hypothetical protein
VWILSRYILGNTSALFVRPLRRPFCSDTRFYPADARLIIGKNIAIWTVLKFGDEFGMDVSISSANGICMHTHGLRSPDGDKEILAIKCSINMVHLCFPSSWWPR